MEIYESFGKRWIVWDEKRIYLSPDDIIAKVEAPSMKTTQILTGASSKTLINNSSFLIFIIDYNRYHDLCWKNYFGDPFFL